LTALSLPSNPDDLLCEHARVLDAAYRDVGGRLEADTAVSVDDKGRLHVVAPGDRRAAQLDLATQEVNGLLPRVDLPEVILEVMLWHPGFVAAFTAASGGQTRLDDLDITIAACLTAHALNIGFSPIVKRASRRCVGLSQLADDLLRRMPRALHPDRPRSPMIQGA